MAEERLLDDDKDRKYRIKKNADGEDELFVYGDEEEETPEEVSFEVPEEYEDDEEMACLTPEQYEAARAAREEEERRKREKLNEYLDLAEDSLNKERFDGALDYVISAEEYGTDGRLACIKLAAKTHNLTDFTDCEQITEIANLVNDNASLEQKTELNKKFKKQVSARAQETEKKLNELTELNEKGKQERREVLLPRRKQATILAAVNLSIAVAFIIVAACLSTVMFSDKNGTLFVTTIVIAVLALLSLVALIFTMRKFVIACRLASANERNSSTKTGREQTEAQRLYDALTAVLYAINPENHVVAESAESAAETAENTENLDNAETPESDENAENGAKTDDDIS